MVSFSSSVWKIASGQPDNMALGCAHYSLIEMCKMCSLVSWPQSGDKSHSDPFVPLSSRLLCSQFRGADFSRCLSRCGSGLRCPPPPQVNQPLQMEMFVYLHTERDSEAHWRLRLQAGGGTCRAAH